MQAVALQPKSGVMPPPQTKSNPSATSTGKTAEEPTLNITKGPKTPQVQEGKEQKTPENIPPEANKGGRRSKQRQTRKRERKQKKRRTKGKKKANDKSRQMATTKGKPKNRQTRHFQEGETRETVIK